MSRALQNVETRYHLVENIALTFVYTTRSLRPYFQNHKIIVRIDYPITNFFRNPELAGRMVAWSVELSEFGIKYEPR